MRNQRSFQRLETSSYQCLHHCTIKTCCCFCICRPQLMKLFKTFACSEMQMQVSCLCVFVSVCSCVCVVSLALYLLLSTGALLKSDGSKLTDCSLVSDCSWYSLSQTFAAFILIALAVLCGLLILF